MPGKKGWILGQVPMCLLNHRRFLVPQASIYKAQTDAGFSTFLPWNWNTKTDRGFYHPQLASRQDLLSQVTGHLSSFARCTFGHLVFLQTHLCCVEGAPTPGLVSDLRTCCTAVHGPLCYLRCAHCYFNYFIIFMV